MEIERLKSELTTTQTAYETARQAQVLADQKLAALTAESATRLQAERERFTEQESRTKQHLADLDKMRATMQTQFEAVAGKLLDEKTQKFTDHNKAQVDALLLPLRQQIKEFRERVDTVYKGDTEDRAALKTQIEQLRQLNTRITDEAHALTRALKGQAQTRGAWGELVLERLLESSGLRAGEDYTTQTSMTNDDGRRLRPDVIVRLPDERHLVIDSKVSLVAYEQFANATEDDLRASSLKTHATAVRRHVDELSGKRYDDMGQLNTPDYVLMFVPIEPAFTAAIQADPALYEWAFDRRVILVTAPTLLATLKTIASLWKQDKQTKNALEIAKRGGLLYDKFVGLYTDLENIGQHLDRTRSSYDDALGKLRDGRGNLLGQVDALRELGVRTQKNLPTSDESA
ncbi:DNA recombination protein RmuC [Synoicihabitans lomoniglobus]|uniref:DNA recombination protein RmuC n=1 Tax=Synoicihabitans lomoniglobus TaxID=2909285 RepID=A0AAE9ZRP0_9BACT|nr:DNA recombination protein RmuC [Opitutaceae bacterium LMO-M01]WED62986.1 DNA recombination protein RmuC [Opitutaceae bacterium LMO-M01]